jgi:hypothetical protein
MTPRRYGPLPITRRPKLTWPDGAMVALWVNPNIEFFGLDDIMPGNLNERVPSEHAKVPNVRNWAVRDYGGIWRIMEVLIDRRTTSPNRVQAPTSKNILQAGAVIPAG